MEIKVKDINGKKMYYYDKEWQVPVITEYQIFKLFKEGEDIPEDYFGFPWATMIDNYNCKSDKRLYELIKGYRIKTKKCFTVVQHIFYYKFIELIRDVGITHIFTPHKDKNYEEIEKKYGVKIESISLYPAQMRKNEELKKMEERKYICSFIGQYDKNWYLTDIRERIFKINKSDCYIKRRERWHYNGIVYENKNKTNEEYEKEYKNNLIETKFSLCPSGSGPNSIRIWESISYGCIPVILADTLILSEIKGINWEEYFIIYKENEIENLYEYLKTIPKEKIEEMSKKCERIYKEYFCPEKMNKTIKEYFNIN